MVALAQEYRVRQPAVAGAFYPAGAAGLRAMVERFLTLAHARPIAGVRGIVAPHAGYIYSGPVAAEAFCAAEGARDAVRRVVIFGPAHLVPITGIAAPSHEAFATPLGEVPLDRAAIEALAAEGLVRIDDAPHAPEHAIEVELPFLLMTLGALPVVPLVFGRASLDEARAVLERLWDDDTLLVVSTDLSHYLPYEAARRRDARTAAAIRALREGEIGPDDACGHLALRAALAEARARGLGVRELDLRNSGDTAGDRARVVGYGAWAFVPRG